MDDGIEGKIIAITGASSGIGEATAILLARRGARIVLGARRQERLDDLVSRIRHAGGEAVALVTDVRRRDDVAALVGLATDTYGRLDVLVSNAGVGYTGPLDDLDVERWEEMVDVNVKGLLYGVAEALPVFRAQKSGHFVTILSTSGIKHVPGQAVYAATKNAGRALMEILRQESGPDLRVTGISPGVVRTPFTDWITDPEAQSARDAMMSMAIEPEAIAHAVAYAVEQPAHVDVGDIVIRPTAQA